MRDQLSGGSSVYSGTLAHGSIPLGTYAAAAKHRYSFVVTFPDSGANGADNAFAGTSTSVDYHVHGVQADLSARAPRDDPMRPASVRASLEGPACEAAHDPLTRAFALKLVAIAVGLVLTGVVWSAGTWNR